MQLIKGYKEIWTRRISLKDRLLFGLVLVIFASFYFWLNFIRHSIPFAHFSWGVFGCIAILSVIPIRVPGNFIIKCWLIISSTIGKIIFTILLFLMYFLVISPLFLLVNLLKRKKDLPGSNWVKPTINKDYLNLG